MNNKTRNPLEDYQTALQIFEATVGHGDRLYARLDELEAESDQVNEQSAKLESRRKAALAAFTKSGDSAALDRVKAEIAQLEQKVTNLGNAVECVKGFLDDLKTDLRAEEADLRGTAISYWADVERQALNEVAAIAPVIARAHHAWQSTGRHLSLRDYWETRIPEETKLLDTAQETKVVETDVPVRPPEAPHRLLTSQERINLKRFGTIHPKPPETPKRPIITDEHGRPSQGVSFGPVRVRDADGNLVPL